MSHTFSTLPSHHPIARRRGRRAFTGAAVGLLAVSTATSTVVRAASSTPPPSEIVDVAANLAVSSPDAEVLWEGTIGSDVGQLGVEDCTECDPARPLAPVALDDGRVVVVDQANSRLVVHGDDSTPLTVDLGSWVVEALPVFDAAHLFLLVVPAEFEPEAERSLLVFDRDDLGASPITIGGIVADVEQSASLQLRHGEVVAWGTVVPGITTDAAPNLDVVDHLAEPPRTLDVTFDRASRRWAFPDEWSATQGNIGSGFRDGTVFVSTEDHLVQLAPDGSVYGYEGITTEAAADALFVNESGVYTLDLDVDAGTYRVLITPLATTPSDGDDGTSTTTTSPDDDGSGTGRGTGAIDDCVLGRVVDLVTAINFYTNTSTCLGPDGVVYDTAITGMPCIDGDALWYNDWGWGFESSQFWQSADWSEDFIRFCAEGAGEFPETDPPVTEPATTVAPTTAAPPTDAPTTVAATTTTVAP